MNNPYPVIASVVEGHGEEKALLGLLHRLVPYLREGAYAHVPSPYRLPRDRMPRMLTGTSTPWVVSA